MERKFQNVALSKLTTNPSNNRLTMGQEVAGIKIDAEYRELELLQSAIIDSQGILSPLVVEKQDNGQFQTLQGNRRLSVLQTLKAQGYQEPWFLEYEKGVPCIVVTGLTPDERELLVNDQQQLSYGRSDLLAEVWRMVEQGKSFRDIVRVLDNQLSVFVNQATLNKNKTEWRKDRLTGEKLLSAKMVMYRGQVDNIMIAGYRLGDRFRKELMLYALQWDGRPLPEGQARTIRCWNAGNADTSPINRLQAAKKADMESPAGWHPVSGGENFNEVFKQLQDEFAQFGDKAPKPADSNGKMSMTYSELSTALDIAVSDTVRTVLRYAQKQEGINLKEVDEAVNAQENTYKVLQNALQNGVKGKMATLVQAILDHDVVGIENALSE